MQNLPFFSVIAKMQSPMQDLFSQILTQKNVSIANLSTTLNTFILWRESLLDVGTVTLQMFGYQAVHVFTKLEHIFSSNVHT